MKHRLRPRNQYRILTVLMALLLGTIYTLVPPRAEAISVATHFQSPISDQSREPEMGFLQYWAVNGYSATLHPGEDLRIPSGADPTIVAIANGKVTYHHDVDDNPFGKHLVIEHVLPDGSHVYSHYAHLNSISVALNADVTEGQAIGIMGWTGNVSPQGEGGKHLHFEIRAQDILATSWPPNIDSLGETGVRNWIAAGNPPRYLDPRQFIKQQNRAGEAFLYAETNFRGIGIGIQTPHLYTWWNTPRLMDTKSFTLPAGWSVVIWKDAPNVSGTVLYGTSAYFNSSVTDLTTKYYPPPVGGPIAGHIGGMLFTNSLLPGCYPIALNDSTESGIVYAAELLQQSSCEPPAPAPVPTQPASDGIEIVNISNPATVSPGQTFDPSVTLHLSSGQLVANRDMLKAIPEDDSNRFGAYVHMVVKNNVSGGQNVTFNTTSHPEFRMKAPDQPGVYRSVWRMLVDGKYVGPQVIIQFTVQAQQGPPPNTWDAKYYSSVNLSGSYSYQAYETGTYLFRDWGIGSPNAAVPVDNWSARLVRSFDFPGGQYRFHCQHDDGCRIYIDGQLKVDAWWSESFGGHDWSGYIMPGAHEVKVEFFDQGGEARLEAWWQGPGFIPPFQDCYTNQWCGDYFGNRRAEGTPAFTLNEGDGFLNHDWGQGVPPHGLPGDNFSTRFTRTIPYPCGTYQFHVVADDGVRVFIDNAIKLDEWHNHSADYYDFTTDLSDGNHTVRVDQFEVAGNALINLTWQRTTTCAAYTGDLVVNAGETVFANTIQTSVSASTTSATVGSSVGFGVGDTVLFHQTQGTANVGRWEKNEIAAIDGTAWTLANSLSYSYSSTGGGHAQVIKVPHFSSVTVNSGGTLTALPWNGTTGGILVFESEGAITVDGTVTMTGKGYRGGTTTSSSGREGQQGEGYLALGSNVWDNRPANGSGGGGGSRTSQSSLSTGGGGGGGHAAAGAGGWNINNSGLFGLGGSSVGSADLSTIFFGGGGGQGGNANGYHGGNGGGAILIFGNGVTVNGSLVANGAPQGTNSVSNQDGNGGGGAGGSILIRGTTLSIGTNKVTATGDGGSGGTVGPSGSGSVGRIRIENCGTLTGTTNPAASTVQTCTTSSVTLSAVEDTYAESATPDAVLGSDPYINIDSDPPEVGYLKFNLGSLAGTTVTSAKLRFYVANASNDTQQIKTTSTTWSESSLTWNNKPALGSSVGTISTGGTAGVWKEVDLTAASVQASVGGTYAIGIDQTGTDGLGFPSSENSNAPELVINYTGGATPTNTPVPPTPTNTPIPPTPTNTPVPPTPTSTPAAPNMVELLSAPWDLQAPHSDSIAQQFNTANMLLGKNTMRITYNLHGLMALGGGDSCISFTQDSTEKRISLADYGTNGLDGWQTIDVPISDFGIDTSQPLDDGEMWTHWWYSGPYHVEITSIKVYTQ